MANLVKLLNLLENSMTWNLALIAFNNRDNAAFSIAGWYVDAGMVVNTLAGNDIISGIGGTSNSDINNGITNKVSISNNGTIITGAGNDSIYGISDGIGIYNTGTINTGTGKDNITGIGNVVGIYTFGTINTGAGNDTITGISTGGDLSSSKTSIFNIGIFNDEFTIDTGTGNDIVSGTGNFGISNTGTINTGAGNDTVSAIVGGFSGNGSIYLGTGNDTLIGFGTGNFYGGTGTDKLLLGEGIYAISGSAIDSGGASMNASQFEQIGGVNGGIFSYSDGIVIVNADGVASFA
jgi:hypothetical protein